MKNAVVLFVLALLMAACTADTSIETTANTDASSESTTTESTTTEPTTTESAPAQTEPETQQETQAETAEAAEPEPTVDTSSPAAQIGADDWCTAAQLVDDRFEEVDIAFGDPETLKEAYLDAATMIRQARAVAPPVIAGDVDVTIRGVDLLIEVLEQAEWDFLAVDFSALDALDAEMNAASYNIEKYNFDVCGIGEEPVEPVLDVDPFANDDGVPLTGTVGEQMIQGLIDGGFTQAEAECIVNGVDFSDAEGFADPSAMLEVFTECGIPLERLAQLGG